MNKIKKPTKQQVKTEPKGKKKKKYEPVDRKSPLTKEEKEKLEKSKWGELVKKMIDD